MVKKMNEDELQILSLFHEDEIDDMGRLSIHSDGAYHYYPALLTGWKKIIDLSDDDIYEAVKSLYQKHLIELTWDKDLNIESIRLNENGARIYGDYRAEMMDEENKSDD